MVMHALYLLDVSRTIELTCDEKVRTDLEHDNHANKEIGGRELTCDEKVRTGVEHNDHANKEIAG
jgi:hypothetical protein